MITKTEFERQYCERSSITLKRYRGWFITLPCSCDYEECRGWAAVHNHPDMVADHIELYSPREGE